MANNRPGQKIKMTSIDELLCVAYASGTTEIAISGEDCLAGLGRAQR